MPHFAYYGHKGGLFIYGFSLSKGLWYATIQSIFGPVPYMEGYTDWSQTSFRSFIHLFLQFPYEQLESFILIGAGAGIFTRLIWLPTKLFPLGPDAPKELKNGIRCQTYNRIKNWRKKLHCFICLPDSEKKERALWGRSIQCNLQVRVRAQLKGWIGPE